MFRKHASAMRGRLHWPTHAFGKGAVVLVGVALVGVVAVTTAWTSARTAAPVHLYWANNTPGWGAKPAATTLGRARLDGTGVEHRFLSGAGRRPCGVTLDRKHIYWGELQGGEVGSPDVGGAIGRANRDGSGVNARFIPPPAGGGCGVAIAGSHMYWASGGAIARANVDGTGVDGQFIPGLAIPRSPLSAARAASPWPGSTSTGPSGTKQHARDDRARKPRRHRCQSALHHRRRQRLRHCRGRRPHLLGKPSSRFEALVGDRTRQPRRNRGQPALHPHRRRPMRRRRLPGSHLLGGVEGRLRTPQHDDRTCQPQRLRRQQPVHYRHPRHMRRPRRRLVRAYSYGVRDRSCSARRRPVLGPPRDAARNVTASDEGGSAATFLIQSAGVNRQVRPPGRMGAHHRHLDRHPRYGRPSRALRRRTRSRRLAGQRQREDAVRRLSQRALTTSPGETSGCLGAGGGSRPLRLTGDAVKRRCGVGTVLS